MDWYGNTVNDERVGAEGEAGYMLEFHLWEGVLRDIAMY
jgi:hypothetical protein